MYDKDGKPVVIPMKDRPAARRFFATSNGWLSILCLGFAIVLANHPSSEPTPGRSYLFLKLINVVLGPLFGPYAESVFFAVAGVGFAYVGVRQAIDWTERKNWKGITD